MPDSLVTLTVEGFPDDLRRRLKAEAALRGMTLRAAITEAAAAWCQDLPSDNGKETGNDHGS